MTRKPDDRDVEDATGAFTPAGLPASLANQRTDQLEAGTGVYEVKDPDTFAGPSTPPAAPDETVNGPLAAPPVSVGDATCASAAAQEPGDATCDSAPAVEPGDATCDSAPAAAPGDATCDSAAPVEPGNATAMFGANLSRAPRTVRSERAGQTQGGSLGEAVTGAGHAGHYTLKKFHARGGMGEIWIAEDDALRRSVALKRMRGSVGSSYRDQFLREAQVTGQLEHPGVVPVHELGVDDEGQPYYVMKFVHGQTLSTVIEEYHKPAASGSEPKEVQQLKLLNMFLSLCQTMAYAHSREVIHRDLKPDNVMIGSFGETLVLDWGLAKVMGQTDESGELPSVRLSSSGDTLETQAGTVKGTPSYMAPEMAQGKVSEVDQASDIFLLGATLYHILTGRKPRTAKKLSELLQLAKTQAAVPPRQVVPSVPKPLEAICQRAMAMNKAERYPSAAALAKDVERYLAGEPVSAYRETFSERVWRWMRRHQALLTRAAVGLAVSAVVVGATLAVREADRRRQEAQKLAQELEGQEQARKDLARFRLLAEEARFFAANADPIDDNAPFFDPKKGEARSQEALDVADAWGPDLGKLPLEEAVRRDARNELYDLLLLASHVKMRKQDAAEAGAALALLDRAAALETSSRGLYRLRAEAYALAGEAERSAAARARAQDNALPLGALDHYLRGEELRLAALRVKQEKVKEGPRTELLKDAVAEYLAALKADPDHYWSHYQLGRTYLGLERLAEAIGTLGARVALKPEAPWSYSARGFALSQVGRFDEALADMDKALKLDPDSRPARQNWALAMFAKKTREGNTDLTDVLAALDAVLAPPDEKKLVEAAFFRANIRLVRKEYDQALEDLDLLLAHKLEYPLVHLNRARVFLTRGENDKVLTSLDAYLAAGGKFDKDSADGFERRGKELRNLANEVEPKRRGGLILLALAQFQTAVKLGGRTASLYDELGGVLELTRKTKEAIDAYSKALEITPRDARVLVKRGWAWEKLQPPQYERARQDFADALGFDARHAEAHTGLGYIEACLKVPAEARRHANLAILHGGGDYLILHNVACIYATLSLTEATRVREHHDLTIDLLRQAIDLWRKGDRQGPDELRLIDREPSFPRALRDRPEFMKLTSATN